MVAWGSFINNCATDVTYILFAFLTPIPSRSVHAAKNHGVINLALLLGQRHFSGTLGEGRQGKKALGTAKPRME